MDEKPLPVADSVFFPYYVNQNRLLDIYAILNRGFSEYEEIKEESSSGKSSSKRGGGAGVGFKIFKLGITAEAELIRILEIRVLRNQSWSRPQLPC